MNNPWVFNFQSYHRNASKKDTQIQYFWSQEAAKVDYRFLSYNE